MMAVARFAKGQLGFAVVALTIRVHLCPSVVARRGTRERYPVSYSQPLPQLTTMATERKLTKIAYCARHKNRHLTPQDENEIRIPQPPTVC